MTSDPTNFRLVQKILLENKTEFHTYSLPEERALKVVLKGIPLDISNDELKQELLDLNFNVTYIRRFGTPDKPMPLCLVHIASNPTAKDIFLVTNLFYVQISVESFKTSGPAQCFFCQRFGHGSRNCGYPPRCVKCAGNHSASDCQKTSDQTPTCCNCGGQHTANFRGCPQYAAQTLQTRIQTQTNAKPKAHQTTLTNLPPPPPPPPPPSSNTAKTYASAASGSVSSPPLQSPSTPQINLTLILNLLTNLLTAMSNNQDPKTMIESTIKTFLTILSPQNG